MKQQFEKRLKKVKGELKENRLDALLVSNTSNRFWLTGYKGDAESGWVLVSKDQVYYITDSRYTEHVEKSTRNTKIIEIETPLHQSWKKIITRIKVRKIGVEASSLSVGYFDKLSRESKGSIQVILTENIVEELRAVKDNSEIEKIKKACDIVDIAFKRILNFVKPGLQELELAWEIEKLIRDAGAEKAAWDPFIVATGPNSSMAHWGASRSKLKKNDMVLVDFGAVYEGYYSDLSRVFFLGQPNVEQKRIYELVLEAQKRATEQVRGGAIPAEIDKSTRSFLKKHTKHFYTHSIGHGVGLEVHELPRVNPKAKNKLVAGNTITIEPGVYIPGWGGVRIEDVVLVTKGGAQFLTTSPKDIKDVTI
ncbi:MAG: hypothetical protein A2864_01255 [Candidatus Woykebacteria bacterium RIFCSPHIGHO2_01_FULL_39_12]|uniref:Xaa-Pro dipeptidase n=1 Tax=Candidatus Woykebacteria bacterium RIFCSPHIGHO2_01_FULL_39_12 TaxID=1802599 RepID=A0A1G1WGY3_9BACT|nr:MAG: hypothetical protein A2864_01255 [Candidatus Woykebacteria bacterium RIFCSPHIGHO2_01_FULL_39_12]